MNYDLNTAESRIIFCDLNSAFAMAEQQAHPSLRGRPMGVTNRVSKHCCVIAASYEAKALGIRVRDRLKDVLAVCPDFIILETDPPKYHHMYKALVRILKTYSPDVRMKSIDEGMIDLNGTMETINKGRRLEDIGYEIKQRLREDVGTWVKVNIGIAPNRFLAKQAASWHKPDGLDKLDHTNLLDYYKSIELTDLSGIARRFKGRLNAAGIFTPMQFLEASENTLQRYVFHSIVGSDWAHRLRGYEADNITMRLGTVGRQWVLSTPSNDDSFILPCFQYLCETAGKKLRYQGVDARGIVVWARFQNGEHWRLRQMFKTSFFTDQELYRRALSLLKQRPKHMIVQTMGVTCYQLTPSLRHQLSLLDDINKDDRLTEAMDDINERYGSFKLLAANTLNGSKLVKQKIPFGSTKYFELLLVQA
jgi:DNA polymerase-4